MLFFFLVYLRNWSQACRSLTRCGASALAGITTRVLNDLPSPDYSISTRNKELHFPLPPCYPIFHRNPCLYPATAFPRHQLSFSRTHSVFVRSSTSHSFFITSSLLYLLQRSRIPSLSSFSYSITRSSFLPVLLYKAALPLIFPLYPNHPFSFPRPVIHSFTRFSSSFPPFISRSFVLYLSFTFPPSFSLHCSATNPWTKFIEKRIFQPLSLCFCSASALRVPLRLFVVYRVLISEITQTPWELS